MTTEKTTKDLPTTTNIEGLGVLALQSALKAYYRPPVATNQALAKLARMPRQDIQKLLSGSISGTWLSLPKQDNPFTERQLLFAACWQREQLEAKLGLQPNLVAGTSHEDVNAGLKRYRLRDDAGRIEEIAVPLSNDDPQSLPLFEKPMVVVNERSSPLQRALASVRIRDASLTVHDRIEILQEWMADDNDAAAQFITQELTLDDLSSEWRNALIYAAEVVRFRDSDAKTGAVDVLLKHATQLRHSAERGVSEVVWCAIHRVGSIIPVQRASELSVFLGPSKSVDTRLAALQAIVRIFEVAPPDRPADFWELTDPAINLAKAMWNPIVFTVGEISAIAIEATVSSAALADERVLELVSHAREVNRPWVMRKLLKRFSELLVLWKNFPAASSSRMLVQEASVRLSQHCEERR